MAKLMKWLIELGTGFLDMMRLQDEDTQEEDPDEGDGKDKNEDC